MGFRHPGFYRSQQVGKPDRSRSSGLTLFQLPCRHSDTTGERFFHIVIPLFIGIFGFIIAISTMRLAARYVAL